VPGGTGRGGGLAGRHAGELLLHGRAVERERGDAGEGKIWVALLRSLLEKGEIWVLTHP